MEQHIHIPIKGIRITNIDGEQVWLDGKVISSNIDHDVNTATVTVEFVGVSLVEVDYKIQRP